MWLICKWHVQVGKSNPHSQEALLDQIAIAIASRLVVQDVHWPEVICICVLAFSNPSLHMQDSRWSTCLLCFHSVDRQTLATTHIVRVNFCSLPAAWIYPLPPQFGHHLK